MTPDPIRRAASGDVTDGPMAGDIAGALPPDRMMLLLTAEL